MLSRIRWSFGELAALAGFLILALFSACSESPVGPPEAIENLPRSLTPEEALVLASSNAFGFNLLREVDQRRGSDQPNTVLSPLSASMALGMALEGTDGDTYTAMRDALGFGGMSREAVNASYEGLLDLLLDLDPAVELSIANSAWARQGFPFLESYFQSVTTHFDAVVQELDFGGPSAKDVINAWVEEETRGHIEEIVGEVNPSDILFLINAVYFKGDWTTRFEKSQTQSAPFHLADGSTVNVPTMSGDISYAGYAWLDSGRQVLALPYGGKAFEMVVVVPGLDETLNDVVAELDDDAWALATEALYYREVVVQMPRFELEWEGQFNEPLKAMGMEAAFDPNAADFSRLTSVEGAHISRVNQKTYLKVDEEGTTAAAATSVVITLSSGHLAVAVDRPFVVAIRERLSGAILFLGAIRDPR